METIVKNGVEHKRNLTEEERLEIQAKNTPQRDSKGKLLKGSTGNPAGRPKKEHTIVDIFRDHKNAEELINKLYKVAGTIDQKNPHKDSMTALKLIVERFIPQLKASELRIGEADEKGFVFLPEQKEPEKE
tara:strand:- start:73 stop:465 length:393 start_codon:yes stop_codon:yes gene_type:complete